VYAQGAGWLFRVDRSDLATTEAPGGPSRHRGGQALTLGTGATFVVGGTDGEGAAMTRHGVFVPALEVL
jgi:hypothetical protein